MSFLTFIARRILTMIPLLVLLSIITYTLIIQGSGGLIRLYTLEQTHIERALLEVELGLDRSPVTNYFHWLGEVLKGNIGVIDDRVGGETGLYSYVFDRLGKSLYLLFSSILLSLFIGLLGGLWAALVPTGILTKSIHLFISFFVTVPNFIFGFFLIFFFAVRLRILPVGGFEGIEAGLGDIQGVSLLLHRLRHLLLPALTLSLPMAAFFTNHVMNGIRDVVDKEYIRTAHAKGLSFLRVLFKHILPNGLSPLMAGFFALLPHFIGSLVIVEVIFSWPGLAYFAFDQGLEGDYYVLFIVLLFTALLVLGGGVLTEILHAFLDPKIRNEDMVTTISLQMNRRLLLFTGFALLFSLFYYPLQGFLEDLPTSLSHYFSGLLLLSYSLWRLAQRNNLLEKKGVSFSLRDVCQTIGLLFHPFLRGRSRTLKLGLLLFLVLFILMSWPWDYSSLHDTMDSRVLMRNRRQPPTLTSPFGTDEMGYDVLLKTLYHGRETIALSFRMVMIAIVVGGSLGLLAGYMGGILQLLLSYLFQLFSSFPLYFLVMLALPFLSSQRGDITILLGLIGALQIYKVIELKTISLMRQEFVEGAYALGNNHLGLLRRHIFPNILPLLLGHGSLLSGQLMVYISALGFLGFISWGGWGELMTQGRYYEWWMKLGPSIFLVLTVLSLYLIGRGVLKTIDPFQTEDTI